jgi:hypothetical protein
MVVLWGQMANPSSSLVRALRAYQQRGSTRRSRPQRSPAPKRAPHLNSTELDRLVGRYQAGASVYELATHFSINRKTVARQLKAAGVPLRLQSPRPAQLDEMVRLYRTGLSLAAVGQQLGFGARTVERCVKARHVATRDSHGREVS